MTFPDLYPPPGQPSNPPTWEDIERLALHYQVLHQAATLVERGDLTREQALILAVYALADSFQRLFHAEVERRRNESLSPVVFPKASGGAKE